MFYVFTVFNADKLSEIEHNQLIKEFDDIYNPQLLKQKKLIDKININCM